MANLVAFERFNLYEFDFNYYVRTIVSSTFSDNANLTFRGVVYEDRVTVLAGESRALSLYGSGFIVNSLGAVSGGTVTAISETHNGSGTEQWYAQGFSMSAASIYSAALTSDNADEVELIAAALAGNDTITLSAFDDEARGFAGDDEMTGGGGNDVLDGGAGTDTAVFATTLAEANIRFEGEVCIVSTPGEGTDRLSGFEFARFAGETQTIAALMELSRPRVVGFSPADGAAEVGVATNIRVTFSESIERGFGAIYLRSGSTSGPLVEQFDVASSARLTIANAELTIDPTADLVQGTHYFLQFEAGSIRGVDGGDIAALSDYDFTTVASAPLATNWRLFTTDGFAGSVGGSGQVFGTQSLQDISVLNRPGSVSFDASFNRGGDIIRLAGPASAWSVARSGSSAVFNDGDTTITIPVGTAGTAIVFDDGVRALKFDGSLGSFRIGTQTFASTPQAISAVTDGTPLPTGADDQAHGRLIVAGGGTAAAAGQLEVFGTNGVERVEVLGGNAHFDGSFNRGGDVVSLPFAAEAFTAVRQGSSVRLQSETLELLLPVGTAGLALEFVGGDERDLLFSSAAGGVLIGDQLITAAVAALTAFA